MMSTNQTTGPTNPLVLCVFLYFSLTSMSAFPAGSHDLAHAHKIGFGKPVDVSQADRTVTVTLRDMAFYPEEIVVEEGEAVRFVLHNAGKVLHEFNIGTAHMHEEHQKERQVMMQHGVVTSKSFSRQKIVGHSGRGDSLIHGDPNSKLLAPGTSEELVWKFDKSAVLEFACNIPGHYESGMMGAFVFGEPTEHLPLAD